MAHSPFAAIRAKDLSIPPYQPTHRAEDGLFQSIRDNFDKDALGVFLVSDRDGQCWVIDGQRRRAACLATGYEEPIPCYVFHGLTEERERQIWRALDVRSNQHVIDRFRSLVGASKRPAKLDPIGKVAWDIEEQLRKHGLMVGYVKSATVVTGVRTLEILYHWGSLPAVLGVIRGAWPGDDHATDPNILMALGAFDFLYRNLYVEYDLQNALAEKLPSTLLQAARADRRDGRFDSYLGRSLWATVGIRMRKYYHEYLRHTGAGRNLQLPQFQQPKLPNEKLLISRPHNTIPRNRGA